MLLTYEHIQARLALPILGEHVESKEQGGRKIEFVSWGNIAGYLDHRAPGWDWEIVTMTFESGKTPDVGFDVTEMGEDCYGGWSPREYMVGCLTIKSRDGLVRRMAASDEKLSKESYGGATTALESACLRRAAGKHGFCRTAWTGVNNPRDKRIAACDPKRLAELAAAVEEQFAHVYAELAAAR